MRIDPKTRFMMEFIAKTRGQSISTVVERAILEAADNAHVGANGKTWRDYWHLIEGVRALQLASDQSLYPSYEDECRLDFARKHWPFFFTTSDCKTIKSWNVEFLWPEIDRYIEIWEQTKSTHYFLAGEAMQGALRAAGLLAPDWPEKTSVKAPPPAPPKALAGTGAPSWEPAGGDLDDEIPF